MMIKLKRRLKKKITRGLIVEALKLDDSGFIFTEDEHDDMPHSSMNVNTLPLLTIPHSKITE